MTDLVEVAGLVENERFVRGDVADRGFVRELMEGVDGVVHLAGVVGAGFSFDEVLGANIVGTHHVFEGAVACGVANVVYASSHHVVGFIRRGERIDHETLHRPDSEYGLSKAFGESAAAFFADKFGLNVLSVRIGYVGERVENERRLHTWISGRDLAQLVGIGLRTEGLGHELVYGVSEVPEAFFDNGNAERLGYRPEDRAVDFVTGAEVFDEVPDLRTVEEGVVGGGFAGVGFCGDVGRVLGEGVGRRNGAAGGQGCPPSGEGME